MSKQTVKFAEPLELDNGGLLYETEAAFHTYGQLNSDKSNVIWVCHALTANSDVFDWWSGLFGESQLFNPNKYFIVCANVLGSHYGSTNPLSENPATGQPYFHDFPFITIRDMVKQHARLADHLGIKKINTIIGGSLGGQQALEWSIMEPERIINQILIATNAIHSAWGVAFNESQRMAIENDITWSEKNEFAGLQGMKVARSIALLSYRTNKIYNKTQKQPLDAKTYQQYQGEKLAKRFNAFSYWYLSHAMDNHNVGDKRGPIENVLKGVKSKSLIISIINDVLFPPEDQLVLTNNIPNARAEILDSPYGHDGFLIETPTLTKVISEFIEDLN